MKSKRNKLSNRERDDQLNYLFKSVYELSQELRMTRSLFENYIIWKKAELNREYQVNCRLILFIELRAIGVQP